jgi:putative ABC transport system permease protein
MKFWRQREESLDRELDDYLDRETQERTAAGMSPEEARHAAHRKLGSALRVKEDTRAAWGWTWIERAWQDVRYGCRMLAKSPGFTLVAAISIALGVGANCAMFSAADMLLLRPLPVPHPGEVLTVGFVSGAGPTPLGRAVTSSYLDYLSLRDSNRSFEGLTAFTFFPMRFSIQPDVLPQLKMGAVVSGNFFQAMQVDPQLGRVFQPEEDRVSGRDAVAVLSYDTWKNHFASDPSVLDRKIQLNGIQFVVIGVTPESFTGVEPFVRPAFYTPMMMLPRLSTEPRGLEMREFRAFTVKGRLRPGVTFKQAQAELAALGAGLANTYPDTNRNLRAVALTEFHYRDDQNPTDTRLIAMLLALAGAVLLVACANVAGLLTSRAPVRAREMAVRLSIGAGRARLIRQLLTESVLLAIAGGILGLGVGYAGVQMFKQIQLPTDLVIFPEIALDRRALTFGLMMAAISVILFGLTPAIQTVRADLAGVMKAGDSAPKGRRRTWGRSLLVVGQVAVTLVLLTTATLIYRNFRSLLAKGVGSRIDHLVTMSFDPSLLKYDQPRTRRFYEQLVERASVVSGVKSAALASSVPLKNQVDGAAIVPEGYRFPAGQDRVRLMANRVDEHFFDTMAIEIVKGRGFRETDTADAPRVAVVNQLLTDHYWPGLDPIGKRFRLNDPNGPWVQIVGVTRNLKYIFIAEPPLEFVYLPFWQDPRVRMTLLAESVGDSASLVAPLREMVRGLDPDQPVFDVRTMEELYHMRAIQISNLIIGIIGAMGTMGLLLAVVGLYGLVAYAVNRRTKEFGIRMAIGANAGTVLGMVMRQGAWLALSGLAAGLALSVPVSFMLRSVFPGSGGIDAVTILYVSPALIAITLLAAYMPARRASRVDPIKALRYD